MPDSQDREACYKFWWFSPRLMKGSLCALVLRAQNHFFMKTDCSALVNQPVFALVPLFPEDRVVQTRPVKVQIGGQWTIKPTTLCLQQCSQKGVITSPPNSSS